MVPVSGENGRGGTGDHLYESLCTHLVFKSEDPYLRRLIFRVSHRSYKQKQKEEAHLPLYVTGVKRVFMSSKGLAGSPDPTVLFSPPCKSEPLFPESPSTPAGHLMSTVRRLYSKALHPS